MAGRYTKYYEKAVHPDYDKEVVGLSDVYEKDFDRDTIEYTIPPWLDFRPDLIAYSFYGDANLAWVLIVANKIEKSPEGFAKGTTIRVPVSSVVSELIS